MFWFGKKEGEEKQAAPAGRAQADALAGQAAGTQADGRAQADAPAGQAAAGGAQGTGEVFAAAESSPVRAGFSDAPGPAEGRAAQSAVPEAGAAARTPVGDGAETISPEEMEEFAEFKRRKKADELRRRLQMIDHTLLRQTATREEIRKLCEEARTLGFYSVCVQPVYVSLCRTVLKNDPQVKIACVVGFPMGENVTPVKVYETKRAVADGADEIDMVLCVSAVKNGDYAYVKREIKKVVRAAQGRPVKVILETSLLTRDEMVRAACCARDAGAAFVKTSTGYFGGGAKAEDVRLLKETVRGDCLVKASGGIRTAEDFAAMEGAGADRIGTSAGVDIAAQLRQKE